MELYYYDQLGSYRSEQPDAPELWSVPRFVDEVEQVRVALNLNASNFFLLGQSWSGLLAMEYALAYQHLLRGLIISNMMASVPAYGAYADEVLIPAMDPAVAREIQQLEAQEDFDNPRYDALLMEHPYTQHVLCRPLEQWPDAILRMIGHINRAIYVPMQSRVNWVSAVSWPAGISPATWAGSPCPRSRSAPPTTPWIRPTWPGWRVTVLAVAA